MSVNEPEKLLAEAISRFGAEAKKKLDNPAAAGAPEDQLRAPLERLFEDLEAALGMAAHDAVLVGESSLVDLKTRPDYAVTRKNALIGFIEVKAPGKGFLPKNFTDAHDKEQWEKLKALPNLIYTDGNGFSLWRNGEREGEPVYFKGDVRTSGAELSSPPELLSLLTSFFQWQPIIPKSPAQLAEVSARLCRFLREEVNEQMALGAKGLTSLASDWRHVLFPNATDEEFADGYAQAVTFGLLMAKARGISLANGPEAAAKLLKKSNSLIGTALDVLTDESSDPDTLKTSLKTMTRVFDKIEWAKISKGDPDAWLYFYERFLAKYDSKLRKKTGSYYTPPEIVNEMVRLTDDALRTRFGQHNGFASQEVTVADPAVGTGTFLLGILKRIAASAEKDSGPGMVPSAVQEALKRLIAFEIQFGPYAVAQLRMLAEIAELTAKGPEEEIDAKLRLYVADTLADPDEETQWIPASLQPIAESRKQANAIKRKAPITVVIGNPPYKVGAKTLGGWVEDRGALPAPLDDWMPPPEWGVGEHAKHLYNLYVYFWRWAAWKVFGGDPFRSGTDKSDVKWTNRRGIVCFITAAGFLNGPGFQKMRADLRRDADEIWVIDCSPEGQQPAVNTRVFEGVQQPVCIVMASRGESAKADEPARVRFRQLPLGHREEKFKAITQILLDDAGWQEASKEWRASFFPEAEEYWKAYPPIESLFEYDGSGVMPGRTWVIAPDRMSLALRWQRLVQEKDVASKSTLFHPHLRRGKPGDKHLDKVVGEGLFGHPHRTVAVESDTGNVVEPSRYGFRSFDRQWIIPDARLLNQPNPTLWRSYSAKQLYITQPHDRTPENGPALTLTALVPDLHQYNNRGGRAIPLWANAAATQPNVRQAMLIELSILYGREVSAEDVFAYIAAVAAHPGYTSRFAKDLAQPGLRIPITADAKLFEEAAALGREVVWLHTFGERFADPANNRPTSPPRIADGPVIPADGAIPMSAEQFPDEMNYDAGKQRLYVGEGFIDRVPQAVWKYEVSGMPVLRQWFSYRKKDRSRPIIGDRRPPSPLGEIQPNHWLPEYTSELINVLNVLARLVALEPAQADLLTRIVEGSTHSVEKLGDALRKQP
jgi:hypothetical protein